MRGTLVFLYAHQEVGHVQVDLCVAMVGVVEGIVHTLFVCAACVPTCHMVRWHGVHPTAPGGRAVCGLLSGSVSGEQGFAGGLGDTFRAGREAWLFLRWGPTHHVRQDHHEAWARRRRSLANRCRL